MTKLSANILEAAEMTGLSRASIYRLIKDRKITPMKHGKRTLIAVAELERFLADLPKMEAA